MKRRSNVKIALRLFSLVRPLSFQMALAIMCGFFGHLAAIGVPVLGSVALLLTAKGGAVPSSFPPETLMIIIFVLALLRGFLRYGEQYCNHLIAFKLLALIRDRVFLALRRLAPAKLEGRDKGNLIALITSDIELLEVFYAHTISPIAIALLVALSVAVFLVLIHPLLALTALFAYLTVGGIIPVLTAKRGGDGREHRDASASLSAFVLDSLRGLTQIIQFGAGAKRRQQMITKTAELIAVEQKMKDKAGTASAVTQGAIIFFDLLMLLAVTLLYTAGSVTFVQAVVSFVTLLSSFGPFISLSGLGSGLENTFAAADRVQNILDEEPVTKDVTMQPFAPFGDVAAEDVHFSYGDACVLNGLSADFPENSIVGILGQSGSGKSTLLKLLMRFWQAQKGRFLIGGRDINKINTDNLRDLQSYVTQETHLFRDSIAANLRVAKPDATLEELESACKKASVHDFVQTLPQGYETPVGELGDTLSGGERQRLGLARAFLHDAPLLLLDEPTSNLDSLNEAVILKSVAAERDQKTVVLVSHRQSVLGLADHTYEVKDGRVS
jgi:ABC-type multidrug transport system fused ATPase/permease subunit